VRKATQWRWKTFTINWNEVGIRHQGDSHEHVRSAVTFSVDERHQSMLPIKKEARMAFALRSTMLQHVQAARLCPGYDSSPNRFVRTRMRWVRKAFSTAGASRSRQRLDDAAMVGILVRSALGVEGSSLEAAHSGSSRAASITR